MKTANPAEQVRSVPMPNIPHTSPNNFRKDAVSVDIPIHLDSRLAIDYHVTLAVFATSLDNCDHLWEFRFSFFDSGCVPVRIVTSV